MQMKQKYLQYIEYIEYNSLTLHHVLSTGRLKATVAPRRKSRSYTARLTNSCLKEEEKTNTILGIRLVICGH